MLSFEGLLKRISPTLKRITKGLDGHFFYFDNNDLFQEALLYLWLRFSKGDLTDKTVSYILQGCYFHLKNYLRRKENRMVGSVPIELIEETRLPVVKDNDEFENRMIIEQVWNRCRSDREKELLKFCMEGLTIREIGARMGISHPMVLKMKNSIKDRCARLNN
jgi:RNA polymerase sigma factor (sigma-70 family)